MNSKEYTLPNGKKAVFEYDVCGIGKMTLECMDELMAMIADRPSAVDLSSVYSTAYKSGYDKGYADAVQGIADEMVKQGKCIVQDRPQGEWIGYNADKEDWLRTDGTPIFLVCDKCHETVLSNASAHWNFCPNCGCRMKGADDE